MGSSYSSPLIHRRPRLLQHSLQSKRGTSQALCLRQCRAACMYTNNAPIVGNADTTSLTDVPVNSFAISPLCCISCTTKHRNLKHSPLSPYIGNCHPDLRKRQLNVHAGKQLTPVPVATGTRGGGNTHHYMTQSLTSWQSRGGWVFWDPPWPQCRV